MADVDEITEAVLRYRDKASYKTIPLNERAMESGRRAAVVRDAVLTALRRGEPFSDVVRRCTFGEPWVRTQLRLKAPELIP